MALAGKSGHDCYVGSHYHINSTNLPTLMGIGRGRTPTSHNDALIWSCSCLCAPGPRITSSPEASTSSSNAPANESVSTRSEKPKNSSESSPAVRFASNVETISPQPSDINHLISPPDSQDASPSATSDQIRNLSRTLQNTNLQEKRLNNFMFEPYSLPPSRVGTLFTLIYLSYSHGCAIICTKVAL